MKRVLSFLMTFALFVTCFSNVAFAEEATGESNEAVYANETNEVTVNLKMGDTVTYTLDGSIDVGEGEYSVTNEGIVDVEVTPGEYISYPYSMAKLANTDHTFNGSEIDLTNCLFTFESDNGSNYYVSHGTGVDAVYLVHGGTGATNGKPCIASKASIAVTYDSGKGQFYFLSGSNYLFFWKNEGRLEFDRGTNKNSDGYYFDLFTPSDNTEEPDIYGYEKVTEIVAGKSYLIASKAENDKYYVLKPVISSNNFDYVAEVVSYEMPRVPKVVLANDIGKDNFIGDTKKASDCLFTFSSTGEDGKYYISAETEGKIKRYLNHKRGQTIPTSTTETKIIVHSVNVDNEGNQETFFKFEDLTNMNAGAYLYFHAQSDTDSLTYNRNSNIENDTTYKISFELYERSLASEESDIPGFVRVDSVEDGGEYLIAHKGFNDENYYFMYPSNGTSNFNHVAKLTTEMVDDPEIVDTEIIFTGVAEGKTVVVVGGVTYNITVANEDVEFTLRKGESFVVVGEPQKEDQLDTSIVKQNVDVASASPYNKYTLADSSTAIADGYYLIVKGQYVLTNNKAVFSKNGLALKQANISNTNYAQYIWKIQKVRSVEENDGSTKYLYTIQDLNGKYINIDGQHVYLKSTPQELTINKDGEYFRIANAGYYLDHYTNEGAVVGAWNSAGDNNKWYFYTGSDSEIVSAIEVKANGAGTARFSVSGYDYTIHFVDTEALEALITKAEEAFTPGSKEYFGEEAYVQALDAAKECLNDATAGTQEDIDTATANLEAAIANLVEIPASTPAENGIKAGVAGYSLVLEGNIVVKFHMQIEEGLVTEENKANLSMEFTLANGEESDPIKSSCEEKNGYYVFECPVPVKDMGTTITGKIVFNGDGVSKESAAFEYTVQAYIDHMQENSDSYANEITLVEKMEAFGTSAATYFNEEATVNPMSPDDKEVLEASLKSALGLEEEKQPDLPTEDIYYGSSLLLRSDTVLRHYFIGDVTLDTNTNPGWKKVGKDGYCYVEYEGITANMLGTTKTVTVVGNDETITIEYSPLTYAYLALESNDDEKLICLMKAMYDYWEEAYAYIK